MRSVSLLLYLSLASGTATANVVGSPTKGPHPNYLTLHAKTRGFQLGRPQKTVPTPDGKQVLFLRSVSDSPELRLYEFDVGSGKTRELLTPAQLLKGADEQLSLEEKARRERMRQTLRGFTSFELSPDGKFVLVVLSGRLYTFSRADGKVVELTPIVEATPHAAQAASAHPPAAPDREPIFDPQLSPDGKSVGYVRGRDLYVLEIATRKERRLTHSNNPFITYGQAEFVAQEELHRFSGFWFSPDSQAIAFTEVDNRPVETLYVGDVLRPDLPPHPMRYPRAGTDNALVRLGVLPLVGSAQPQFADLPRERYPYIATVVWQAGGPLLVTLLSRDQHDLALYSVDGKTAKAESLLTEHDDAWINIDQDVPKVLKDGTGFLWTSEREGGRELELRDLGGRLQRVLVPKTDGFRKLLSVDAETGYVTYAAATEPSEQHLFRIPLLGGSPQQLTREPGYYAASFGKSGSVYVRQAMSLTSVPKLTVHRVERSQSQLQTGPGTEVDPSAGELASVAVAPPYLPKVEIAQVGPQAIRVALIRPRNFVPGRKYPVLVDVYGGPHHTQVMAVGGRYLMDQWLADHGFIVLAADGRGTPFRGTAWEHAVAGNFGDIPLEDQIDALNAAADRFPELDRKRVGIFGWSFGGYMAALAVLRRPDVFQVGVAGAPVVDWRDYDTCYTERYLGMPNENKDGYDKSSLLTYAAELKRPLLILHGTADDNVLFFHSLKLSNALFRAGKPHELLPLPGLTHMVPDPVVTERMWTRIVSFLSGPLKPTP